MNNSMPLEDKAEDHIKVSLRSENRIPQSEVLMLMLVENEKELDGISHLLRGLSR